MGFCRSWLLIFCALILSGSQLLAAPSREERAFAAATAALQDGSYDRAETEFARFTNSFPKSVRIPEAVLALAQAQYQQGKYTVARELLSAPPVDPGTLAARYAYWLGEAESAQGDFERAAETFLALVKNFPESPLGLTAVVEAAAAFERLGDWPRMTELLGATNGIFARAAEQDNANELVSRGQLLLVQAQLAQESYAGALATLRMLNPLTLSPDLDWKRANLLCQVEAGAKNWDAALVAATNLLQIARAQRDAGRVADSVAWHGTVLERMGRWEEAGTAWSENLTNTAPVEWQRESILKMAEMAVAQTNFAAAEAGLGDFLEKFTNSPAAELARLTLGELHLKEFIADLRATNQLALAQANFDRLLAADAYGPLSGKAFLDRGWCFWLSDKWPESEADFRAAVTRLPVSADLAVAKFKLGDALYAQTNFVAARASYQSVLDEFGNVPAVARALSDRAFYQILRANLELTNAPGAEAVMRQMLAKYPASELADSSLLLLGEGFSDWGLTTNALSTFQEFKKLFPDSPLTPQVELARARTFERDQKWPEAIATYAGWLQEFPTNDLLPQVEYALAWANFQAGQETNALSRFTNFVARFSTNELAPLAQWWVADHYFRLGGLGVTNYQDAEQNYELIFQTPAWINSTLFYPAQLMAARAALGRAGFQDAADYLTKLVSNTNCPPELATQARFVYGGALMRMVSTDTNRPFANFELAADVFTKLYQENTTNELGGLAGSELADCLKQMGSLDAATNAYAQVIDSPFARVDLRARARVGLGLVLEMKAEAAAPELRQAFLKAALENYLNVFYTDDNAADAFWTKKAGLQALPLMVSLVTDQNQLDAFINRLEDNLPQLKEMLEKKRAALTVPKS
jgi:TolA-binding protein